jgi:hypothetical protein
MIDVHWRQVSHLPLAEVEPDTGPDVGYRTDRDGHLFAAPQVTLLEEHVGHMVTVGVDDKPFD